MSIPTAKSVLQPFHLSGSAGRLFALEIAPVEPSGTAVLYCPPFAEELNRTRHSVTLAARRMAELGVKVLLVDLFGTGDSDGDFADARWETWVLDMHRAIARLREQAVTQLVIWGLRSGALLAAELAAELDGLVDRLLLWHPVTKGSVFMTQFLRLRLAADMIGESAEVQGTSELRRRLERGESIEIAGYELSPALHAAVDARDLQGYADAGLPPLEWIDVASAAGRSPGGAARRVVEALRSAGIEVNYQTVVAPAFWATPEIVVPGALIDETVAIVEALVENPGVALPAGQP